jgi:hypothetical protein
MYLPFTPRSIAVAGTVVIPIEKMIVATKVATRNLTRLDLIIDAPGAVKCFPTATRVKPTAEISLEAASKNAVNCIHSPQTGKIEGKIVACRGLRF